MSRRPGRSRKGAWIEIKTKVDAAKNGIVAPVRERGLKLLLLLACLIAFLLSLP